MAQIVDGFHARLKQRIEAEIEKRKERLAKGSASVSRGDVVTVAEKYAAQVSAIEVYGTILDLCEEVSSDIYGTKRSED
jgi:hypothetical protein